MSSTAFNPRAGWSWGDLPPQDPTSSDSINPPGAFPQQESTPEQEASQGRAAKPEDDTPPRPKKHYPLRTCRICLEDVLPTFDPIPEGRLSSMLNPTPKVSYISSDPTSGRLIRPCKCRGSQKYVHEGCLQQWRHADPSYGRRTFWECPTCKTQYRLERLKWSRWITSTTLQIVITMAIMLTTIFVFGFIADPIINLYLDPYDTITSTATGGKIPAIHLEDDDGSWTEHFVKGLASLGLLGFVKVFFAMSPWHWWNLRQGGFLGGGRRQGGRERMQNISWMVVLVGVLTFLYGVWRWVRAWTRRTLEKASERVVDIKGDDDDDEDEEPPSSTTDGWTEDSSNATGAENRKTQ